MLGEISRLSLFRRLQFLNEVFSPVAPVDLHQPVIAIKGEVYPLWENSFQLQRTKIVFEFAQELPEERRKEVRESGEVFFHVTAVLRRFVQTKGYFGREDCIDMIMVRQNVKTGEIMTTGVDGEPVPQEHIFEYADFFHSFENEVVVFDSNALRGQKEGMG
jgi:hypothetical protein